NVERVGAAGLADDGDGLCLGGPGHCPAVVQGPDRSIRLRVAGLRRCGTVRDSGGDDGTAVAITAAATPMGEGSPRTAAWLAGRPAAAGGGAASRTRRVSAGRSRRPMVPVTDSSC